MKGDALKALASHAAAKTEPTDAEMAAAISDGVDLLVGFYGFMETIAVNIEAMNREGISIAT